MGGLRARNNYRYCQACGRTLEPGERCECNQPRDGLRARCPKFRARSSYRGMHYLDCGGHKLRANTRSSRDTFYAAYCCSETWERCPFQREIKEE